MRIFLALLVLLALSAVSYLQFSDATKVNEAALVSAVNDHLLKTTRENSAESFNQSLEKESFGKILDRAADLLTTRVTIVNLRKSEALLSKASNRHVIVDVDYILEKTSSDAQTQQAYLTFTAVGNDRWVYRHNSTEMDFYLNFLGFE